MASNKNNRRSTEKPKREPLSYLPWAILLIVIIILAALSPRIVSIVQTTNTPALELSYSNFRQAVTSGNIENVNIINRRIEGNFQEPVEAEVDGETTEYPRFYSYIPEIGDDSLLPLLEQNGVEIEARPETGFSWSTALTSFLPILLFGGLAFFLYRNLQGQGQGILPQRNKARLYDRRIEQTTFEDVAGERGAKYELQEIIEILQDPSRFSRLGAATPKGVLLVGPPGTGKTLLARAVAGEASVPFYSITGSDFMEMFVGVGASRVRELFNEAKRHAPAIIFIDELDSIGRRRNLGAGGSQEEREQTLNQLLSEMDGFTPNQGIIVIAATNRPEVLDPALMRAGRFDRRVVVDLPSLHDRCEILQTHARNKPLSKLVDLQALARGTPGFSGADLENLLNEAALMAARKNRDAIAPEDIEDARDKILMGLERDSVLMTEEESRLIAYHEAGHAILAAILPHADPIHKVTIIPRGRAMGVTQQLPEREKYIYPREYMLDRLAVMMGGRAAEQMIFRTATSGAENDLKQATNLARKMVLDWGMSRRMENIALGSRNEQIFLGEETSTSREYSETTAREVDQEVRAILEESYQRAAQILLERSKELDALAKMLTENEIVSGREILELVGLDENHISFNSPIKEVLWEQEKDLEGAQEDEERLGGKA